MSVTFDQVNFSYPQKQVLENISLTIEPKKMAAIIGPNGGGKTTFLRLTAGLLSPTSGKISIETTSAHKMGYVPQNLHFDRKFPISVLDLVLSPFIREVSWFGRYPKSAKKKAYAALERLDLLQHKDTSFGDLSGGLAQRAFIARAIVDDPEILLLDEPTSNVDPEARQQVLDWINRNKGEMTIILVTHDLEVAVQNMDSIFCIDKTLTPYLPKDVCEHFAIGLYHAPLKPKEK